MMKFKNIDYLENGNQKQQKLFHILSEYRIIENVREYNPIITGTIPIEIDTEESDVDICCYWNDRSSFINSLSQFKAFTGFNINEKLINDNLTIIARFNLEGFLFEIFGQNRPVDQQEAYRHMIIEYKILKQKGHLFKEEIIRLKKSGIKTEPAFGRLLGLNDNPYKQLLEYDI